MMQDMLAMETRNRQISSLPVINLDGDEDLNDDHDDAERESATDIINQMKKKQEDENKGFMGSVFKNQDIPDS